MTLNNLTSLPEGVFQMGQEDSSSKGYFIYTSTSTKRRVRIRFGLWSMYDRDLARNPERKKSLQLFFNNFEKFEKGIEHKIESLLFFHDEYTDTKIDILLKNGERVIKNRGDKDFDIKDGFLIRLMEDILEI